MSTPSERARAADRFRAALEHAKSSTQQRSHRLPADERESGAKCAPYSFVFELRPEGLVLMGSDPYPFSTVRAAGANAEHSIATKVHRAQIATETAERSLRDASLAIEHVRVGRAGQTVRLHATVSHGAHQGVELRAVSKDGRVEVELRAADGEAAQRLRAEMSSLRAALDAQGIDRVRVSVVDASGQGTEAARAHSEGQRREHRERDQTRVGDSDERAEGSVRASVAARDASDQEAQREWRDASDDLL